MSKEEGRKEERKKEFFSRKEENSSPQTPEVLENWAEEKREREAKVSFGSSAKKNMFSFYGFCKSIGF